MIKLTKDKRCYKNNRHRFNDLIMVIIQKSKHFGLTNKIKCTLNMAWRGLFKNINNMKTLNTNKTKYLINRNSLFILIGLDAQIFILN